mmetsp:Transcript_16866/g.23708  ORF Transcript_16866/g.23708 Transcript_16866/m.23708 type:complete len:564 (-) Transcript_16866:19-1710(-)
MQINRDTTPQLSGLLRKLRHSLEKQAKILKVLLHCLPFLIPQDFVELSIDRVGSVKQNGSVELFADSGFGVASLLCCQVAPLVDTAVNLVQVTQLRSSSFESSRDRQFHDPIDWCKSFIGLHVFKAHSQVELQEFFFGLQFFDGANRFGALTSKVGRDERKELRRMVDNVGRIFRTNRSFQFGQNILPLFDLRLRQPTHWSIVFTVIITPPFLNFDQLVFIGFLDEVVSVTPIVGRFVLELFLKPFDGSLQVSTFGVQLVLPVFSNSPPSSPHKVGIAFGQQLNNVVLVVVATNVCLVELDGIVLVDCHCILTGNQAIRACPFRRRRWRPCGFGFSFGRSSWGNSFYCLFGWHGFRFLGGRLLIFFFTAIAALLETREQVCFFASCLEAFGLTSFLQFASSHRLVIFLTLFVFHSPSPSTSVIFQTLDHVSLLASSWELSVDQSGFEFRSAHTVIIRTSLRRGCFLCRGFLCWSFLGASLFTSSNTHKPCLIMNRDTHDFGFVVLCCACFFTEQQSARLGHGRNNFSSMLHHQCRKCFPIHRKLARDAHSFATEKTHLLRDTQ